MAKKDKKIGLFVVGHPYTSPAEIFHAYYKTDEEYRSIMSQLFDVIDMMCWAFNKPGITSELNEMQNEVPGDNNFELKTTIPLYFINLVLKKYNMMICKED